MPGLSPTSSRPKTISFLDCRIYAAYGSAIYPSGRFYGVGQLGELKSTVSSMKVSDACPVLRCSHTQYLVDSKDDVWQMTEFLVPEEFFFEP